MIKTSTPLGYIRLFVHPKAASTSRLEAKKSRNVDHLDAAFRRFYIWLLAEQSQHVTPDFDTATRLS